MRRFRLLSLSVAVAMLSTAAAGPVAIAASAPAATNVVEREVVQAKLSPTGEPEQSRVYSQLTVTGDGTYSVADPTGTDDLRNLSGFGAPAVEDGVAQWELEVDGQRSVRTVADYDKELPLAVSVAHELDGEAIEPADLIGRSGTLTTTYTVRNVSAAPIEISYKDGAGITQTESVELPLPLAGTFSATLPPTFTDVVAEGGIVAGDGRGGTKLSWSLIMFKPLGDVKQTISYTAEVRDAIVPAASLQAVPVTIGQTPLASGDKAYSDAADSTYELTRGATEIDLNVQRLAAGAGTLLNGLIELANGAAALSEGLASAADGSGQLADGLVQADDGGGELGDGLGELNAGAVKLANGLGTAEDGGSELAAGLGELEAGTGKLSAGLNDASAGGEEIAAGAEQIAAGNDAAAVGAGDILTGLKQIEGGLLQLDAEMPAALQGAEELLAGVQFLRGVLGDPGTPDTIMYGLSQLAGKDGNPGLPFIRSSYDALNTVLSGSVSPGLAGVSGTLADQAAQLDAALAAATLAGCVDCLTPIGTAKAQSEGAKTTVDSLKGAVDTVSGNMTALSSGLADSASGAEELYFGVLAIIAGIDANDPNDPGLILGLTLLRDGLAEGVDGIALLAAGSTLARDGQADLRRGLKRLAAGAGELAAGSDALSGGLGQLSAGGEELAAGMNKAAAGGEELADGLGQLSDGGGELAAGTAKAAAGGSELSSGLHQLREGGDRLASGLGDAADGGGKLADGLSLAKIGGGQVAQGAEDLSTRGTAVLAGKVGDANAEQNRNVAMIEALDERSRTGGMPVGSPENAESSGVYAFELASADATGTQSMTRLVLAAFALVAVAGLALRRRVLGL